MQKNLVIKNNVKVYAKCKYFKRKVQKIQPSIITD